MVTMGRVVVTMLALTGDVRDSPIVKQHWLNTMASIPAKKNISKSRGVDIFFMSAEKGSEPKA